MARQRTQVEDVRFSVAPKPTARVVDTFARAPQATVDNGLTNFITAIAPIVEQKAKEEQASKERLAKATQEGIVQKQAYEAKNAVRKLAQLGAEDFENNYDLYLDKSAEEVASMRQGNYDSYYQQLEAQGVSSPVIRMIRKEMEAVDYKFFTEAFNPAKREKDEGIALNSLGEQLQALADRPPENALVQGQLAIAEFMELYPTINKGKISDFVFDQEKAHALTLDEDGYQKGKSWRSEWLVQNDRTNTKRNRDNWTSIENAHTRGINGRAEAVTKSVKATAETLSAPIVAQMINEIDIKADEYYNDAEGLKAYYTQFLSLRVEEIREKHGDAVADAFQVKTETEFNKKFTKENGLQVKFAKRRNEEHLSDVVTGAVTFMRDTDTPLEERSQSFNTYADTVIAEAGISEEKFAEKLMEQQVLLTEDLGMDTPAMRWLASKGYTIDEQYTDEMVKIKDADLERRNKFYVRDMVGASLGDMMESGNTAIVPRTVVDLKGNTITISDAQRDSYFEQVYGNLPMKEKIEKYYARYGRVPTQAKSFMENGFSFYTSPDAPDADQLAFAEQSFKAYEELQKYGLNLSSVVDETMSKKFTIVDYYMKDAKLPFAEAFEKARMADVTLPKPAGLNSRIESKWNDGFFSSEYETFGVKNSYYSTRQISEDVHTLMQSGVPEPMAIAKGLELFEKNHLVVTDTFGNTKYAFKHFVQDASSLKNATQSINQAVKLIPTLPITKKLVEDAVGFGEFGAEGGEFGIRIDPNPYDYNMVNIIIIDKDGADLFPAGSIGRFDLINDPDNLQKLWTASIVSNKALLEPEPIVEPDTSP